MHQTLPRFAGVACTPANLGVPRQPQLSAHSLLACTRSREACVVPLLYDAFHLGLRSFVVF